MKDNLIKLKPKLDPKVAKLVKLGKDIDDLVVAAIEDQLASPEVCAVVSHRLGHYLSLFANKEDQLDVMLDILLTEAGFTK